MPEFMPLFPLSLVVFPGESFRLHIFEERYKQLIGECVQEGKTFGVPTVIDQGVGTIATEVRVVSVDREYNGGEMDVSTEGIQRFEILQFYHEAPGKLYAGADVTWLTDDFNVDPDLQQQVFDLLEELNSMLGIHRELAGGAGGIRAYDLGHQIGFTLKQEYELLALRTETDRLTFIRQYIQEMLPVVRQTQQMKARAKLNGHYKNIVPPNF